MASVCSTPRSHELPQAKAMESSLLPRFTHTRVHASCPIFSPTLPRSSLRLHTPPHHICLSASSPGGSNSTDDGEGDRSNISDKAGLVAQLRKVIDAYHNSNNDLRTFLQNLVDTNVLDESDVFSGAGDYDDDDALLRALIEMDLPGRDPDLGVLWKLPAIAALSFTGVPALLGYLGDVAGARVPAWVPLAYSLASFLLGSLLVVDASVSGEEWVHRQEHEGQLEFLESEEVLWQAARRVSATALTADTAGEVALHVAAQVTGPLERF